MLKYYLSAFALKAFSVHPITRRCYRALGNVIGERRRKRQLTGIDTYVSRGDLLIKMCRDHLLIGDNARCLELGTGWLCWYGMYLALHYDVQLSLFDVWDNRQLAALMPALRELEHLWVEQDGNDSRRVRKLRQIQSCSSWEQIYDVLHADYQIRQDGSAGLYPPSHFDFLTTFHVLEHVPRGIIETVIRDTYRILKPGGTFMHQIGIDDHLTHYDKIESEKKYLEYSDRYYQMMCENVVQYHNRLQASQFMRMFNEAGFIILDSVYACCNIDKLNVHPQYRNFAIDDLSTTTLTVVGMKPA